MFVVADPRPANDMVAVGDEEGHVRLLDAANEPGVDFSQHHLAFQAHGNAIIDMAFSDDDYRLATASGDQTARVFDMMTRTPISLLGHHTASLKQVRFQPGSSNGNVLASCGRDGSIQVWDLRCSGPVAEIPPIHASRTLEYRVPRQMSVGSVINLIYGAHASRYRQLGINPAAASLDVASRSEVPGRIGEVSVTSLQFLGPGREHLLLSACEADASVRLWDIRSIHTSRNRSCEPLSFTRSPDSHTTWRPFGISSLSLSGDGARLYALCKDNTVYAYSTAHLITGHAPELSYKTEPPRPKYGAAQAGLGPLYGFRHDMLHATSFYIKSALRPARNGRSELLAVGSNDSCAVVFPTDERYFKHAFAQAEALRASQHDNGTSLLPASIYRTLTTNDSDGRRPSSLHRTNSISSIYPRLADTVPIIRSSGTALIRGHDREVGAVAWTHAGDLITVGDDYHVRCWREDRAKAADLRTGGETDGRRWMSGWADVGPVWDEGEDEWD
jgi:WD40 repeat protein